METRKRYALIPAATAAALLSGAVVVTGAVTDFELPGTQPLGLGHPAGAVILDEFVPPLAGAGVPAWSLACESCHSNPAQLSRPLHPWQGSMMAQSARDPLFWAQLDLTIGDATTRPAVAGMADVCLRCHSPVGWLEGRSSDLSGMGFIEKDIHGVQCHACHRVVDPALPVADIDHTNLLAPLSGAFGIPPTYGNGMYVMDRKHVRRGPYTAAEMPAHPDDVDSPALPWTSVTTGHFHPIKYSAFHRSGNLCGTCHDVSNPVDCDVGFTKADTQRCFPIERTWTEWKHSVFSTMGEAGNCQSCHMSGPLNGIGFGAVCEGGADHLNDVHVHDFTGGNAFIPKVIREMKQRYETPSATLCSGAADVAACISAENNFKVAVEQLYPPSGASPFAGVSDSALQDGIARVHRTLKRAAYLDISAVSPDLTVKVTNRSGHRLPTGYPEGRRMWLNVKFLSTTGSLLAESGRYEPTSGLLYHDQDLDGLADGPASPDSIQYTDATGTALGIGRPTKVWEARLEHQATGTEFHFALNDHLLMDNRIPAEGWTVPAWQSNRALPEIPTVYTTNGWQSDYGKTTPPEIHWDLFDYQVPMGTDRVDLGLYYQTISKEYAEALSADNPNTLTAGGYNRGTLFFEVYDRAARSQPVVMARRIHAIVDTDGDGLSDGWESTYGFGGGDDYNLDPDGDGWSNWQEFQNGTDPTVAEIVTRQPIDIMLVLDVSGSMGGAAPGTSTPKIDVLQEAVELFLETWAQYAVPGDRIGAVFFGSEPMIWTGAPALKSFVDEWENLRAAVSALTQGGWTAMGAGLYHAFEAFTDPSRPRHVILFSNGMQNFSPMVVPDAFGDLVLRPQTTADNPEVRGQSSVHATLAGADYAVPNGVKIHTVGVGVVESGGPEAWHQLLYDLSKQPGREGRHNFITRAFDLEGVFLEDLVEALKTNTLYYVLRAERTLTAGADEIFEIPVNPTASRFSVVVSWSGQQAAAPHLELTRPDGRVEELDHLVRTGPFYRIITRYLQDFDAAPDDYGHWKLRATWAGRDPGDDDVRSAAKALRLQVHALLDESEVQTRFMIPGRRLRLGEPLRVTAVASQGSQLLKVMDVVSVQWERPETSVQEALARSRHKGDVGAGANADLASSPFAAKVLAAFSDASFVDRLRRSADVLELTDDGTGGDEVAGDGMFTGFLPTPTVPGHYQVYLRMAGHSASGARFERAESRSLVVRIGVLDASRSRIRRARADGRDVIQLTPRDRAGNLLGPGYGGQILVETGGRQLAVEDLLDGRYRAELPAGFTSTDSVRMILDGETFHDGPARSAGLFERIPWWVWLLLLLLVVWILWRVFGA